ncbi:hypothetical protein ACF0H5_013107 [Mactra antiquata]
MFYLSLTYLIPFTLILVEILLTTKTTAAEKDNQKRRHKHHHHHHHHQKQQHDIIQNDIPEDNWNDWLPWTECSVDCGAGVQKRTRTCGQTSSEDVPSRCRGTDAQYKLCEITGCLRPVKDMCKHLEKRIFRGKRYRWVPYVHPNHACDMACRAHGAGFFLSLDKKYPDGTPCADDKSKACISGMCKNVGCDGIIDSEAQIDACGICGGDGSTCKLVKKTFTDSVKFGYHTIVTIPRGSTSIVIREISQSRNYLALKATDGSLSINSDFRLARFGEHVGAGTVFKYERSSGEDCPDECIRADGPTSVSIDVMILAYADNKGVEYSFHVPSGYTDYDDVTDEGRPSVYIDGGIVPVSETKLSGETDDLDLNQGSQTERRPIFSSDFKFNKDKSSSNHANNDKKPENSNRVDDNTVEDPGNVESRDNVETTTDTSVDTDGARINTEVTDSVEIGERPLNINKTDALQSPQPGVIVDQNDTTVIKGDMYTNDNRIPSLYTWSLSGYTDCSATCGEGKKSPIIECIVTDKKVKVDDRFCRDEVKPTNSVVQCNLGPCPPRWKADSWSQCSATCGMGTQSRDYICVRPDGAVVHDFQCPSPRPSRDQQSCDMGSCTSGWYYTDWPEYCPATCGYGTVTRGVYCFNEDGSDSKVCSERDRPKSQKSCRNDDCGGIWLTGPWSNCNATCGVAYQTRAVACGQNHGGRISIVSENACRNAEKPATEMSCEINTCVPEWYMSEWGRCSVTCGNGYKSRDIQCRDETKKQSSSCDARLKPIDKEPCTERRCPPSDQSRPSNPTPERTSRQPGPTRQPRPTERPPKRNPQSKPDHSGNDDCVDSFSQCSVVLQARLCQYSYYQRACCYTCSLGQPNT